MSTPRVIDELVRRGLYDPDAADAEARLELLQFNLSHGLSVDDLVEAERFGRMAYAAGDMYIRPNGRPLTIPELAEATGVPIAEVARLWRVAGFPDPVGEACGTTEADVEVINVFREIEAMFGEETAIQLLRTTGWALSRVAEASLTAFATRVAAELVRSKGPVDLARATVSVGQLLPRVGTLLDVLYRHHLQSTIDQLMADPTTRESETKQVAVGFADLVGYTAWTARSDSHTLALLVEQFEARAQDVATAKGGRVVKMIGDEVMFVAGDPATACAVAAGIVAEARHLNGISQIRAGLACGDVLAMNGDYYGPVVNLAARLVAAAEPGTVLVAPEIRDRSDGSGWTFRPAGPRTLKGFPEPIDTYELLTPTQFQR